MKNVYHVPLGFIEEFEIPVPSEDSLLSQFADEFNDLHDDVVIDGHRYLPAQVLRHVDYKTYRIKYLQWLDDNFEELPNSLFVEPADAQQILHAWHDLLDVARDQSWSEVPRDVIMVLDSKACIERYWGVEIYEDPRHGDEAHLICKLGNNLFVTDQYEAHEVLDSLGLIHHRPGHFRIVE
jgi:hypothetical protein